MTVTHAGPDMPTISHPNADLMTAGTLSYAAAPMQAKEPPQPDRSAHYGPGPGFYVTGCLNCAHCRDDGHPHKPERWVCAGIVDEAGPHLCYMARNDPTLCALQARFYGDALIGR